MQVLDKRESSASGRGFPSLEKSLNCFILLCPKYEGFWMSFHNKRRWEGVFVNKQRWQDVFVDKMI